MAEISRNVVNSALRLLGVDLARGSDRTATTTSNREEAPRELTLDMVRDARALLDQHFVPEPATISPRDALRAEYDRMMRTGEVGPMMEAARLRGEPIHHMMPVRRYGESPAETYRNGVRALQERMADTIEVTIREDVAFASDTYIVTTTDVFTLSAYRSTVEFTDETPVDTVAGNVASQHAFELARHLGRDRDWRLRAEHHIIDQIMSWHYRALQQRYVHGGGRATRDHMRDTMRYATERMTSRIRTSRPSTTPYTAQQGFAAKEFELDGWKARLIDSKELLAEEGENMQHCIAGAYRTTIERGTYFAYHVDTPPGIKPRSGFTTGFHYRKGNDVPFVFDQVKGKKNDVHHCNNPALLRMISLIEKSINKQENDNVKKHQEAIEAIKEETFRFSKPQNGEPWRKLTAEETRDRFGTPCIDAWVGGKNDLNPEAVHDEAKSAVQSQIVHDALRQQSRTENQERVEDRSGNENHATRTQLDFFPTSYFSDTFI